MKRILITGADSYIGTSVEQWLLKWPEEYKIETIDMRESKWEQYSFSEYDVVFHVAGIAHVSTNHKLDELYYNVNRDLAIKVAEKARKEGVSQFIFMSSGILYGVDEPVGKRVMITNDTEPKPTNAYGKSKLQADTAIAAMNAPCFKTVCVRTPMVYGKGCKGNFQLLNRYADSLFILPDITNYRSMIHIDNLANFIKCRVDLGDGGIFWPQNSDYIATNHIVEEIRKLHGKKTHYSKCLGIVIKALSKIVPKLRKIYGDLAYSKELSTAEYIVYNFEETIKLSM